MATAKKAPATKKKAPAKKAPAKKRALPAALVSRAKALHDASAAQHLKAARAALARARSALEGAERGLYEMALALRDLDDPKLLAAVGYATLYEAADRELGLGRTTVARLRRAADAVDAETFARLGHTRINAMLALADATPADDTEAILAEKPVTLWDGGPRFVVKGASSRSLDAAAAQVRAHLAEEGAPATLRGNRVSKGDVALAAKLTKALAARDVAVTVTARATRPGGGARFAVDGLDADGAKALLAAIAAPKSRTA
ncbi:MAG: hypothetical protein JWM10_2367 [Myxococcaceae bacterium]|nr:hypothetical protein [Myxococcaceae bacterium]